MADEVGRATPAQVGLTDVMEHLAIAFGGIYEKLGERDMVVNTLATQIAQLNDDVLALSNRIEGIHRSLSERIKLAATGTDTR